MSDTTAAKSRYWSDRLSPILVKELRQGMSSRFFVFVFLVSQAAMVLILIVSLAEGVTRRSGVGTGLFWFTVIGTLLFVFPLMGMNALGQEVRGRTIELVSLTRLTATRIVIGKWVALVCQAFLLVTAILPYFVLRYLVGEVDIVDEAALMAALTGFSVLFIGMAVGASAVNNSAARVILVIMVTFFAIGFAMDELVGRSLGRGGRHLEMLLVTFGLGIPITLWVMEWGAGMISPMAENHDARKRILGVVLYLVGGGFLALGMDEEVVFSLLGMASIVICGSALLSQPVWVAGIYRPFVRRGFAGRLLGRTLLYPGWQTGTLFSLLVALAWWVLFATHERWDEDEATAFVGIVGGMLLPVALHKLLFGGRGSPVVFFFLVQAFFLIVTLLVVLLAEVGLTDSLGYLIAPFPNCTLVLMMTDFTRRNEGVYLFLSGAGTLACVAVLIGCHVRALGRFKRMEEAAAELPAGAAANR